MPYPGVQGLRWEALVNGPIERPAYRTSGVERVITGRHTGLADDAEVTSRGPGGAPQGFWPAALRGRVSGAITAAYAMRPKHRARNTYPVTVDPREVAQPQRFVAARNGGEYSPEFADVLYFDGGFSGPNMLPRWAQRFQVPRTTHEYNRSNATHKSYGASATASGPEGTLVLFPLHIPRRMATRAAVGGNLIQRSFGASRVGIPGVTVVQAAGWYP